MKKPKKVNYIVIPEKDGGRVTEPYKLLNQVRADWHGEISPARIALAWRVREKEDADGHLTLGKCVKVSDLQKEFAAYDFIIVLNREVWESVEFTQEKKVALLDHELCHAAQSFDSETGEEKIDERGRPVFRIRKHDIEEFKAVVERHGTYKRDLERFAEALLRRKNNPLFAQKEEETKVQIGLRGEDGKMNYSEPIAVSALTKAADTLRKGAN